jgi:hypothetical protein
MSWRIKGASHPLVLNGLFAYLKNPYWGARGLPPPAPRGQN